MKKITQEGFEEIYKLHQLWLETKGEEGEQLKLSNCDLTGLDFDRIRALSSNNRLNFAKAELYENNFSGINLSRSRFYATDLTGSNFTEADLLRSSFLKADLYQANLSRANLLNTNFLGATLYGANLSDAIFFNANMALADLRKAKYNLNDLSKAANLDKAKLDTQLSDDPTANLKSRISNLENEKYNLLSDLEKTQEERDRLGRELNEKIKALQIILEEKEQNFKTRKKKEFKNAFDMLDSSTESIDKEIRRLNIRYWTFSTGIILLFLLLASVWVIYFLEQLKGIDINNLLFVVPSIIIIGMIWGALLQTNHDHKFIVMLKKYNSRTDYIRSYINFYIELFESEAEANTKLNCIMEELINDAKEEKIDIVMRDGNKLPKWLKTLDRLYTSLSDNIQKNTEAIKNLKS